MRIIFAVLLCASTGAHLLPNDTVCPIEALVDLSDKFRYTDGSIEHEGLIYPLETQRIIDARVMGCPCMLRPCLSVCCDAIECQRPFAPSLALPSSRNRAGDFWQFSWDPCHGGDRYALEPEVCQDSEYCEDRFELLTDGSMVRENETFLFSDFCLQYFGEKLRVLMCFDIPGRNIPPPPNDVKPFVPIGMLTSVPFLVLTFLVYIILPELMNIHGKTLCAYVLCLIVAYLTLANLQITNSDGDLACFIKAYIVHFSFLASFFWLNVMCFDIWWTFGGFRSLQGSVRQRERKKFIMYSIYAWGWASILTVICLIMDLAPGIPSTYVKPEFGKGSCWFNTRLARALYFYGPMGVTVICNICLFILTAIKIVRHKKDTARHLKSSESRRHDDNKQWFNLYLKLFIVMGITWSMEIISWLLEEKLPKYIFYLTDLTNTLQGVIIFLIFVWKNKIKRLLIKRFGLEGRWLSRTSTTRSGNPQNTNSSSRTTCVTTAHLQEKPGLLAFVRSNKLANTTDDSDAGV